MKSPRVLEAAVRVSMMGDIWEDDGKSAVNLAAIYFVSNIVSVGNKHNSFDCLKYLLMPKIR